jgi:hypothetical protein
LCRYSEAELLPLHFAAEGGEIEALVKPADDALNEEGDEEKKKQLAASLHNLLQ